MDDKNNLFPSMEKDTIQTKDEAYKLGYADGQAELARLRELYDSTLAQLHATQKDRQHAHETVERLGYILARLEDKNDRLTRITLALIERMPSDEKRDLLAAFGDLDDLEAVLGIEKEKV